MTTENKVYSKEIRETLNEIFTEYKVGLTGTRISTNSDEVYDAGFAISSFQTNIKLKTGKEISYESAVERIMDLYQIPEPVINSLWRLIDLKK